MSVGEARAAAARTDPEEGDRICHAVLELARRVVVGSVATEALGPARGPVVVERYPPVPTTPDSRWLDCLDSETRAGWPSYLRS